MTKAKTRTSKVQNATPELAPTSSSKLNQAAAPDIIPAPPVNAFRRPKSDPVSALIRRKLGRIQSGEAIRYMDMFAGAGGISLGFLTAGFLPVASVENDPWAAKTHGANFGGKSLGGDRPAHHVPRDATSESPARLFADLNLTGPNNDQIDLLDVLG